MKKKLRRPAKILVICLVALVSLCVIGGVWNTIATHNDEVKYPPLGQIVDGFDCKLHVFSSDKVQTKAPTIVLLSRWGTTSPTIDFYPLWSQLDEHTVVLERPGYGWSEETKRDRTVENIMEEDRLALKYAGYSPPYLLVAHSMGGLEATYYANSYPDEVFGVVLIDSMAPEITLQSTDKRAFLDSVVPVAKTIGLLRLVNCISPSVIDGTYAKQNNYSLVDDSFLAMERALTLKNAQSSMMLKEWDMIKAMIKVGAFPHTKELKEFDFSFQETIPKEQIIEFASHRFIYENENLVFMGSSGVGKTHLATSIGISAAKKRISTYFIKCHDLIAQLKKAKRENRLEDRLRHFTKYKLLIIDELGYLPIEKEDSKLFFQLIDKRYEKRSTIITTNINFSNWDTIFMDPVIASAILDRVLHHAHVISIIGKSYRLKNYYQEEEQIVHS